MCLLLAGDQDFSSLVASILKVKFLVCPSQVDEDCSPCYFDLLLTTLQQQYELFPLQLECSYVQKQLKLTCEKYLGAGCNISMRLLVLKTGTPISPALRQVPMLLNKLQSLATKIRENSKCNSTIKLENAIAVFLAFQPIFFSNTASSTPLYSQCSHRMVTQSSHHEQLIS